MKLQMMAVYDSAALAYLPPFVVASVEMAVRVLRTQLDQQKSHDFVRYGDQFILYRVAEFDNETGHVTPCLVESIGSMLRLLQTGAGPEGVRDVAG